MKNNLENEDILILKARVERAKGNANDAILYYDKTIEANPFNANAYKERGELKTEMGDRTNGLNDIKYATELLNQQDGDAGNENIEKKVGDAYKNANPFGV